MTTDERTYRMNQIMAESSLSRVQAIRTDGGIDQDTSRRYTEVGARIEIARE